mmetsp:Transcript_3544/g.7631  ORF Transcript_3544/g.7631 Transcript_3544/m.7631 type:complete len:102 (-) Transcript_3544:335-640(-)
MIYSDATRMDRTTSIQESIGYIEDVWFRIQICKTILKSSELLARPVWSCRGANRWSSEHNTALKGKSHPDTYAFITNTTRDCARSYERCLKMLQKSMEASS